MWWYRVWLSGHCQPPDLVRWGGSFWRGRERLRIVLDTTLLLLLCLVAVRGGLTITQKEVPHDDLAAVEGLEHAQSPSLASMESEGLGMIPYQGGTVCERAEGLVGAPTLVVTSLTVMLTEPQRNNRVKTVGSNVLGAGLKSSSSSSPSPASGTLALRLAGGDVIVVVDGC